MPNDCLFGYPWLFCHLAGKTYSFIGSIIDNTLKILPVAEIFLWDGTVRDTADVCCSNIGISQARHVQPSSGFGRMIHYQFDPKLDSQQLVVSDTKLSALVHSIHYEWPPVMRDNDVINCLPRGAITAVWGPVMDAFAWIPYICNTEASIVTKKEKTFSIAIGDRINIHVTCDMWLGHHIMWRGYNCCIGNSQDNGYVMGWDVFNNTL